MRSSEFGERDSEFDPNRESRITNSDFSNSDALRTALDALRRKDLTLAELHEALARRGFLPFEAEDAVERLQKWGFVSDERAALSLLARRRGRNARGDEALRRELEERGVPDEITLIALESVEEPDESRRAFDLLLKKFPRGAEAPRAARFLASRGFGEDAIESAVGRFAPFEDESSHFHEP